MFGPSRLTTGCSSENSRVAYVLRDRLLLLLLCVSRLFAVYFFYAGVPKVFLAAQVPYSCHDASLQPLASGLASIPLGSGPAFALTRASSLSLILRLAMKAPPR